MTHWPTKPLLDVAKLTRGSEPGSKSYTDVDKGTRFLRVGDITGKATKPIYSNGSKLVLVQEGDLLLALDGTPGQTSTRHAGAISSGIRKVEVINNEVIAAGWLRHALCSPEVQATIRQHTRGVTILHASSAVPHIEIPLPPLHEQKRLAEILDQADDLRTLRAEAHDHTLRLVSSMFSGMFGDPASPAGHWPMVSLKALGKITTGNTPSRKHPSYFGRAIEWIKTDNIHAANGMVTRASEGLSEEGIGVGRVVPAGSVLITCIAGSRDRIGDAAVVDRPVAINQQINAILPNSLNNSIFICEMIQTLKTVIQHRATGVMTGIISKSGLEAIPAIQPPLALQEQFAERVKDIRSLEAEQAASSTRIDQLFESLLHRAFAGEL